MSLHPPVIAIDGPSASGKGTVAQLVAEKLGFHYLDSGALYRIVAYATQQKNIAWDNATEVTACAKTLDIQFESGKIYLREINGLDTAYNDISEQIRSEEIGKGASKVALHAPLRATLLHLQHHLCQPPGLVADGRDMGSVVFPHALLKIFLTASTEVRAMRRYQQLQAKNLPAHYDTILQDLQERDDRDKNRNSAPLIMAPDAILLETDHLTISEAVNAVLQKYLHKISK